MFKYKRCVTGTLSKFIFFLFYFLWNRNAVFAWLIQSNENKRWKKTGKADILVCIYLSVSTSKKDSYKFLQAIVNIETWYLWRFLLFFVEKVSANHLFKVELLKWWTNRQTWLQLYTRYNLVYFAQSLNSYR